MTEFNNSFIYFDDETVSKYLTDEWKTLVINIENVLKSYSAGKIVQPVRSAVTVKKHEGLLLAMPAYNEETDAMATKVVTLYAENKKCGLPSIHATVLLHDVKNGKLKAVLDGDIITKMRTAAASVVASKYLANKHEILAILGAGAQARSHYKAFCNFYNFKKIFIWNINKESAEILAEEMKQKGLPCEVVTHAESAVKDADIIVTVTTAIRPILKKDWIKKGAHINAVGAPVPEWQELENDLLLSSVIYVDSKEGALAESGDIINSKAPIYAEIGEVILGAKEAFPQKTTIFKSLGMAAEDVAAAELVYNKYMLQNKNSHK